MDTQTLHIHLPSPLAPLTLRVPASTPISSIPLPHHLASNPSTYLRTASSIPHSSTRISSLRHVDNPTYPIRLELCVRMPGGKGGFGSQLRAAGGRMSAGKSTNFDSCRDLSGRRLGTIKEAQRQAELLESAPALRAQAVAAEKAKLEALERTLGITSGPDDQSRGEGSSSGAKRLAELDLEEIAKKRHKFNDNAFLEESREIKDSVRSAVSAGLLKKKKKIVKVDDSAPAASTVKDVKAADEIEQEKDQAKAKAGSPSQTTEGGKEPSSPTTSIKSGVEQVKKAEKDKIAMPPPPMAKATVA